MPYNYCKNCKKRISQNDDLFCSEACKKIFNNLPPKKCENCNKEMEKTSKRRFCSLKCANETQKRNNVVKRHCIQCGKDFYVMKSSRKIKLCSKMCERKYAESKIRNDKRLKTLKKNNLKKFGKEWYFQTEKYKDKFKNTCRDKYGVDNPMQYNDIKNKSKDALINKYGSNYMNAIGLYTGYKRIIKRLPDDIIPLFSIVNYTGTSKYKRYNFKCKKCNTDFNDYLDTGKTPKCPICNPYIMSQPEEDLYNFCISIIDVKEIYRNNRQQISPFELDIFIPIKNLAIEFNGIMWHSQNFGGKDKNYHLNKTDMCTSKGIKLLHIFENEWMYKSDIVKSIIKYNLGIYDKIIYGRKCQIKEIDSTEKNVFLESNHLQGKDISSIRYGLYYEEELVSVMTFSKSRFNKNIEYEMTRFCNKVNTKVIGSASKLLNHFIKNKNPKSIISYADKRYFGGELYNKLGFNFIEDTTPNYFYFESENPLKLMNRIVFQKHKLSKLLSEYSGNISEWENMKNNGYDRIFDCGNKKFIWNK